MARLVLFASLLCVGLLGACGGDEESESSSQTTTAASGGQGAGGQGGAALQGVGGTNVAASVSSAGGEGAMMGSGGGGSVGGGATGGEGGVAPWSGPLYALTLLDLGDVDIHALTEFSIPDRSLGFTVLAKAPQPTNAIGIYRLKSETGDNVVLNYAMAGKNLAIFGGLGLVAVANPQSDSVDAWPVKAEPWEVALGANEELPFANLKAWVRRTADGAFHGGAVDFNVFIAPNTTHSLYVKAMLESLFNKHYGPKLGLSLGKVLYTSAAGQFSVLDSREEYDQMLASSAGIGPVPAVNLFIVGDFHDSQFGGAIGVAGGIPGSPMEHGTTMSGVALQPSGDPDKDALVLAHEIGHLGGLFHTTEFAVDLTDPLSDTVFCDHAKITSQPGQCPDIGNMMFPMAAGGSDISPAQAIVMQGSALYRGTLIAGGQPSPPVPDSAPSNLRVWKKRTELAARGTPITRTTMREPRDEVEKLLGGVWCARSHGYEAAILGAGMSSRLARLKQLALDEKAFDLVRARALRVLDYAHKKRGLRTDVLALAKQMLRGRLARNTALAAVAVLQRDDPSALSALSSRVRGLKDAVVEARLDRGGQR